jgi:hypothetical protein
MKYAMAQEPPWSGDGAAFQTLLQRGGAAIIEPLDKWRSAPSI